MRCWQPHCLLDATHGIYYVPGRRRWQIVTRSDLPGAAPLRYCRWHATAQAVVLNAEHDAEGPKA
jgi:hypothetical protein